MIKRSQAITLAEEKLERRLSSTTPDEIGKKIKRSGAYVRKVFSQTRPSFASQLANGRWIIQDSPEFEAWIGLEKIKGERIQRKNIKSGKQSVILSYHGFITDFKRWQNKVGGLDGPLKWEAHHQIRFIEETIEIARQRHHIIKNLSESDYKKLNIYFLSESERYFFTENQKTIL